MREIISLNENWTLSFPKGDHVTEQVNLPHTWNAVDGNDGSPSSPVRAAAPMLRCSLLR